MDELQKKLGEMEENNPSKEYGPKPLYKRIFNLSFFRNNQLKSRKEYEKIEQVIQKEGIEAGEVIGNLISELEDAFNKNRSMFDWDLEKVIELDKKYNTGYASRISELLRRIVIKRIEQSQNHLKIGSVYRANKYCIIAMKFIEKLKITGVEKQLNDLKKDIILYYIKGGEAKLIGRTFRAHPFYKQTLVYCRGLGLDPSQIPEISKFREKIILKEVESGIKDVKNENSYRATEHYKAALIYCQKMDVDPSTISAIFSLAKEIVLLEIRLVKRDIDGGKLFAAERHLRNAVNYNKEFNTSFDNELDILKQDIDFAFKAKRRY